MPYDLSAAKRAIFAECRTLGIDDCARHAIIRDIGKVASGSSTDMGADAARRVLDHLRAKSATAGRRDHEWSWVDSAPAARRPLLKKLIMLAKSARIRRGGQVRYIEGIANQMAGLGAGAGPVRKPLPMCDEGDLWRIVAALSKHVGRRSS